MKRNEDRSSRLDDRNEERERERERDTKNKILKFEILDGYSASYFVKAFYPKQLRWSNKCDYLQNSPHKSHI